MSVLHPALSISGPRRAGSRAARVLGVGAAAAVLVALVPSGAHASPTAAAAARGPATTDAPLVVAHRGSSGVAPENTVAAATAAVRHRAGSIENDIQRTADGELVLMHDTTLARTTDVEERFPGRAPWRVADFTLAELRTLDAGSWFGEEFAGERIPTLTEWARAVGQRSDMLIEVKSPALYPGIERDLDEALRTDRVLRRAVRQGRVVVQSFDHAWLRTYEAIAPEVPVGLLFSARPTAAAIADAATWAEQVNPAFRVLERADVEAIQSAGLEAHVYTINDGATMRRAIRWGVDGIITDYPQVLRDLLRERR